MATSNQTTSTASSSTSTSATAAAPQAAAHAAFAAFDPMAMWAASQQTWTKLMTEAVGRAQTVADQYVALETQAITRAHEAITTWAQLTHDALAYSVQLSSEARKLGLDAARKMGAQA